MKWYITIVCCFVLLINVKGQSINKVVAKDAFELVINRDTVNTIIIDGRSDEMYATKHIEGAVQIDAFGQQVHAKLKNYLDVKKIIVYCTNHKRAELIIEKLKELKYRGEIIFIIDGINGWISSGYKIVSN